jgi:hypothetical protein
MTALDISISKTKASFDAISASKRHVVVLDSAPERGDAQKTMRISKSQVAKPVAKSAETQFTRHPPGLSDVEPGGAKRPVKGMAKSKKLRKLLGGRVVFDFSN